MKLSSTEEMYLIYIKKLACQNGYVRNADIVQETNKRKSTISKAMKKLEEKQLIYISNHNITLTATGIQAVSSVENKHSNIVDVLIKIGATKEIAEDNAGRIEHVITDELSQILNNYLHS